MQVSGFSFIRNAIKYDYPIVESITSILPICDEFIIAIGKSDDGTEDLIKSINSPKIKIVNTIWDESLRKGGAVLAVETNKAFDNISKNSDWAFYIQGDEVVHEKYLENIYSAMGNWNNEPQVEGLLFKYKHFYGSYDFVGDSRKWYRHEVRIIRNNSKIRSYKDAQGFRLESKPLKVKKINAEIYHYGWVKPPDKQQDKQKYFNKLWHNDEWIEENIPNVNTFDYSKIDSLAKFNSMHPKVMLERIENKNWRFDFDPTKRKLSIKNKILYKFEKLTGYRLGEYKNYKII